MQADITFRGLNLAQGVTLTDQPDGTVFLPSDAPLPVGSSLTVAAAGGKPRPARVASVTELEAGSKAAPGMRLAWLDAEAEDEASAGESGTPSEAQPAAKKGRRKKKH